MNHIHRLVSERDELRAQLRDVRERLNDLQHYLTSEKFQFYVGADHVNAILSVLHMTRGFELEFSLPDGRAGSNRKASSLTAVGQLLLAENIKSIATRYPTNWQELTEGEPTADQFSFALDVRFVTRKDRHIAAIKLISSLEYQSCEHDDWEDSFAAKFLARATSYLIGEIPGYEAAPWHYSKDETDAQVIAL